MTTRRSHRGTLLTAWALLAFAAPTVARQSISESTQTLVHQLDEGFGWQVDVDGTTAIVGAIRANDYTGAAYIFEFAGGSWHYQVALSPSNISQGEWFGRSVAIDGDLAVVGSRGARVGSAGRPARVFRREGGSWPEVAVLTSVDPVEVSVAVSDGTIVVDGVPGTTVFRPAGNSWVVEANLLPPWDGHSLAIDGDVIAIGNGGALNHNGVSTGVVAIYRRSGGAWSGPQIVEGSDSLSGDGFGVSLDLDATTLVAGAFTADPLADSSGAAYIFEYDGLGWQEQAKLVPSNGAELDYFGQSVAVKGPRVVVGAHRSDYIANNKGLAYLFERSGTNWSESAWLVPAALGGLAGFDVALSDSQALVGAPAEGWHGRVYAYSLGSGFTRYCPSTANSTGVPARIDISGSTSISENQFGLTGSSLPRNTFALAIYGETAAKFPLGDGLLCISPFFPGLVRLPVVQVLGNGSVDVPIDFPDLPAHAQITAGSRWNFQLWYRDAVIGGTGSNLSDALNVTFTP